MVKLNKSQKSNQLSMHRDRPIIWRDTEEEVTRLQGMISGGFAISTTFLPISNVKTIVVGESSFETDLSSRSLNKNKQPLPRKSPIKRGKDQLKMNIYLQDRDMN